MSGVELSLTSQERDRIRKHLGRLPSVSVQELDGPILRAVRTCGDCLPERLVERARHLRSRHLERGALLLRNLPLEVRLPPTPWDGRPAPDKSSRLSEYVLLLIMGLFGEPVGYREEKEGVLVHDVCPRPGSESRQENTGSDYFELHTENAFHPFRPDFVGLLCLRQDHERRASTLVATARDALGRMAPEDIAQLRRRAYKTRLPSSFATGLDRDLFVRPKPILRGPQDDPDLCVDAFNTVPIDRDSGAAVRALVAALRSGLNGWALAPGDLLVVDNRRAVHARTAFRARYDGSDRWLQRVFAIVDFERSAPLRARGSHVCAGMLQEWLDDGT